MTTYDASYDGRVPPAGELATIVLRAGDLGFSRQRVATALGLSPADLAVIERRHGLAPEGSGPGAESPPPAHDAFR